MEPVPETERMEAFKSSPVPSFLPKSKAPGIPPLELDVARKPPTIRRSTDPNPTSPTSPSWGPSSIALPYRPRTTSPLSSGHARSRSAATMPSPMSRTQSMPGVNGSGRILYSPQLPRPASPSHSGSPSRIRVPKKPADEIFPITSPVRTSVLDFEKRPTAEECSSPVLGPTVAMASSSRLRRPSSPFRSVPPPSTSSLLLLPSTPSSTSSMRSYDMLSTGYGGSFSSVPSTPTSTRSRSPSISSLETIPDTPDAEEEALKAERLAQLKAAADDDAAAAAETVEEADGKGRASMDALPRGRTLSYGSRDKRKRWSVCGAERRGDLDLETIWED
ncbi:hypothetical protein E4U43_007728 [Claviceps pusilla]|uniref:Basic proline-rich protein n=1 Tax=Claviceps pusilla TaxID=123648 RepID=A0A9P7NEE8_9HYPO|nr:hypothetical protein E4U43_007728 [Claviceps pusilla]